jgi:hypothetical protein
MTATLRSKPALDFGRDGDAAVVEIPLLLPAKRAEALVALSRTRRESVGQILRQMIDRGLAAAAGE